MPRRTEIWTAGTLARCAITWVTFREQDNTSNLVGIELPSSSVGRASRALCFYARTLSSVVILFEKDLGSHCRVGCLEFKTPGIRRSIAPCAARDTRGGAEGSVWSDAVADHNPEPARPAQYSLPELPYAGGLETDPRGSRI